MSPRMMRCPTCQVEMELRDRHGIEIDLCPRCRGVWLEKGELERLLERCGRFLEIPGEDPDDRNGGRRRGDFFPGTFEWF